MFIVLCVFMVALGAICAVSFNMLSENTYIYVEDYYDKFGVNYIVRSCYKRLISDENFHDSYLLFDLLSQIIKCGEVKTQLSVWSSVEKRRKEQIDFIGISVGAYLITIYLMIAPAWWEIIISIAAGVVGAIVTSFFMKKWSDIKYTDKLWDRDIDASKMSRKKTVDALEEYCKWIGNRRNEIDAITEWSCTRTRNAISTTTWLMSIFFFANIVVFCFAYRALL